MLSVMATFENLTVHRDGPTTTITLDRPEKRNALSAAMMAELTEAGCVGFSQAEAAVNQLATSYVATSGLTDEDVLRMCWFVDGVVEAYRREMLELAMGEVWASGQ